MWTLLKKKSVLWHSFLTQWPPPNASVSPLVPLTGKKWMIWQKEDESGWHVTPLSGQGLFLGGTAGSHSVIHSLPHLTSNKSPQVCFSERLAFPKNLTQKSVAMHPRWRDFFCFFGGGREIANYRREIVEKVSCVLWAFALATGARISTGNFCQPMPSAFWDVTSPITPAPPFFDFVSWEKEREKESVKPHSKRKRESIQCACPAARMRLNFLHLPAVDCKFANSFLFPEISIQTEQ